MPGSSQTVNEPPGVSSRVTRWMTRDWKAHRITWPDWCELDDTQGLEIAPWPSFADDALICLEVCWVGDRSCRAAGE